MENIRNQIKELIQTYEKDFYSKTGISLIAHADTRVFTIELESLKYAIEKHLGIKITQKEKGIRNPTRKSDVVRARKFFMKAAIEMGYPDREIGNIIGVDRTTVIRYRDNNDDKNKAFQREYARFKQSLLNEIE